MWTWRERGVAVTCLAVGSVGQLVQYLVSPLGSPEEPVAQRVAAAGARPGAMQVAAWLDLSILLFLPALVVVAVLAGARTSRLAWIAAVVTVGTTLPGTAYLFATDVLYVGAAGGAVPSAAIESYTGAAVVVVATVVFLIGHLAGLVLLAVALWRAGSVPRWAAVCLGLSPVLEIGGSVAGVPVAVVAGYVALIAAFASCAAAVVRPSVRTTAAPVPAGS